MVDTLDAGQDSVVFLGRRSFRMELVEKPTDDGLDIPRRGSDVPTEKIFDRDRDHAAQAVLASLRSRKGISSTTLLTLCSATFVLGIALTLMLSRRLEPRRPIETAASTSGATSIEPMPAAPSVGSMEPVVVALPPPRAPIAIAPARRPPTKLVRAVRPRPAHAAARSDLPAPTPWVDPFAE